ncbi:MAG: 50S ribosomal protein L6 [Deltaproteobacteria bacterium]|nr:50S ribosomal protein L6 [Deltaproteobacteria bacterium]
MSRIGKLPIPIPPGVTVAVSEGAVQVKGPKGALSQALVNRISVDVRDGEVAFIRTKEDRQSRANHGLMRSLVNNMVIGVTQGFQKQLQVKGVGYRADVRGPNLVLQLGYSHPVEYPIPEGIEITSDKTNKITVSGIDKQRVGQVAAVVRSFRPPDHYKGKGVRYVDEYVRLKAGKTA